VGELTTSQQIKANMVGSREQPSFESYFLANILLSPHKLYGARTTSNPTTSGSIGPVSRVARFSTQDTHETEFQVNNELFLV
jgi:hypothetical protein